MNLKIFEKINLLQMYNKQLSMNYNYMSHSPTRQVHNYHNYPTLLHNNHKSYSKQLLIENDKWNSTPKIALNLKNDPILVNLNKQI